MADNIKEFQDTINGVCEMISIADMEAMRTKGQGFQLISNLCELSGNSVAAYNITLTYSEDPDGTKHIIAETAGKIVSDYVFEYEMKKALAQATTAAAVVAMADSPVPGPADIAGAVVFLSTGLRGYAVSKAKSWAAGEFTKNTILKLWPDKNIEKESYEDNKNILKHNSDINTTTINGNEEVQKNIIPAIKKTDTEKIQISSKTYNIVGDNNNLLVRNALDTIPAVSVLLSHIDIYPGDKIDIGDKGIYTAKGGDTFSQIANNNGFNTKELLQKTLGL